jgi:hypothetical protein
MKAMLARIRSHVAAHVRDNRRVIAATVAALLPWIIFDVWLLANGHPSISVRTWNFCDAHPLAAVAGFAADLIPTYLGRRSWPCAAAWAGAGVHLFSFVGAR